MMLYELFSWIKGREKNLLLSQEMVSSSVLKAEYKLALNIQRALRADVHEARSMASTVKNSAPQRLEEHDEYMAFIALGSEGLGGVKEYSSFLLALNYLLQVDVEPLAIHEEKINCLFSLLLKERKEEILNYYSNNQCKFDKYQQVNRLVSTEKYLDQHLDETKEHLAQFTLYLAAQEHAVSIAPLCKEFNDDTEKFAAIILWFLQRGVSIEHILQTNLLQHFMLYHANCIDSLDNPIDQLYALLAAFPNARALVEEAEKIQSEDRSFLCTDSDEEGTCARAITGALREKNTLHRVEIPIPRQVFTSTDENFKSLYHLFGPSFLSEALLWHTQGGDGAWQAVLQHVLNQDMAMTTELPALINFFAVSRSVSVLKSLSSLIDDDTIEKLVMRQDGAVFHLLPYKPTLINRLGVGDIGPYLRQLISRDEQVLDIFPQLLNCFVAFRDVNKAVAVVVYEVILDQAMQHPEYLNDRSLIKILRKFSEKMAVLTNRCALLQSQFDQCLMGHLSKVTLDTDSYHEIKDNWDSFSRQLGLLNEIMPLTSRCPANKYKLYVHLATMYFSTHPSHFILDDFIQALEISPELVAEKVTEYEYLLIELLTTMDDEGIRQAIIKKFETHDAIKPVWFQKKYGEESVFERAVQQGNIGLLSWLEPRINITRPTINEAAIIAAEAKQWEVVDYFCSVSTVRPQQYVFKDLLILAAAAGQVQTMKLCKGAIKHWQVKYVIQGMMQAAANNHRNVIEYFCNLEIRAPSIGMLADAYKVALKSNSHDVIECIGNYPAHLQLVTIGECTLVHAAKRDLLPQVQQLCSLRTNVPGQLAIEKAFLQAIKYHHWSIAHHLDIFLANPSRQKIIDEAFVRAIASGDLHVVQHLCALRPPTIKEIHCSISKAASSGHKYVVDYFRGLLTQRYQRDDLAEGSTEKESHGVRLPHSHQPAHLGGIKKSSSCSLLDRCGLFGTQHQRRAICHRSLTDFTELMFVPTAYSSS